VDDEIADGPVRRANQKILDVTDIAVAGVDIITGDVLDGMEARIAGLAERLHRPRLDNRRDHRRLAERGARARGIPIRLPAEMRVDPHLLLARDRRIAINLGAALHLLP